MSNTACKQKPCESAIIYAEIFSVPNSFTLHQENNREKEVSA